jgi:hypothetical protein
MPDKTRGTSILEVYTAARPADALNAGDGRHAMATIAHVLQPQAQIGMRVAFFLGDFKILNVSFVFQDIRNGDLQAAAGHDHHTVANHRSIAHTGQHIADRI